ncbi:hypothetical protein ACIQOU_06480 [Streptomyces sp. NPDC091279]|uniref:hypothetical protein n=1 Tax=Streptomyces sp. NPDC091279 TaxID=3365983 RepID=UPI00382B8E26
MSVDQLPGHVREFTHYLAGLLARVDQGGGWCAVFWQRDPDGMRACLDGREMPPWDVVEALLQDLAAAYGPEAAAREQEHARTLHLAALDAYDARPGGRDALSDRLDVMLREQRYAVERQAELGRSLACAVTREEADALRLDLAWAHDDHERATARCTELRSRIAESDRRQRGGDATPIRREDGGGFPQQRGPEGSGSESSAPGGAYAGAYGSGASNGGGQGSHGGYGASNGVDRRGYGADGGAGNDGQKAGRQGAPTDPYASGTTGPVRGARAGGEPGPGWQADPDGDPYAPGATGPGRGAPAAGEVGTAWRADPDANPYASGTTGPVRGAPAAGEVGTAWRADPDANPYASGTTGPGQGLRAGGEPRPGWRADPYAPGARAVGRGVHAGAEGAPGQRGAPDDPYTDPGSAAHAPETPDPSVKPRKRRRGSARFAGMASEGDDPVVVPPAAGTDVPAPGGSGGRSPRGARFAGAAAGPEEPQAPAWPEPPADTGLAEEVAAVVAVLVRLRADGRSGEAHVLLVDCAHWPAARFPLLAGELQRAGLGADWATLLWEAASLPADRLVAAADALTVAGRGPDGEQILRQGVARPADEIGGAVLDLLGAGRRREAGALLDAYVRVRAPEEVVHSAEPDPGTLVPLLLEAARSVSPERHRDLAHALRVAGLGG